MTLARPRASVTIDGRALGSAEGAVMRVHVSLSLGGAHDTAEVFLWPKSKFSGASRGSSMSVALANDGDPVDVWTGEVATVAAGADGVAIDGVGATIALSRTRVSQTYLDETVEDIVRDLASPVDIDEVTGDTNLSAFAVDDRRPVWAHVLDLAELVGADVGANAAGALRFVPPRTGRADATLRYGADVLAWSGGDAAHVDAPSVVAGGSASDSGSDKWHWIRRDPASDADAPVRVVAALATRDAADAMTQALADRADRAGVRGRLTIVGRPALRPGDLVAIKDLPGDDPGTLRVLSVDHVLDGREGFVTTLAVEGAGS